MLTPGGDHRVEGSVFRGEALVVAEFGTGSRTEAQRIGGRPASRGNVALFTDSLGGVGAVAAKSLARDGYSVTVYCVMKGEVADGIRFIRIEPSENGGRDAQNK